MKRCKVLMVSTVEMSMGGITTVIMNYHKYIDKEKVQIDFVANDKVEPCLAETIKLSQSRLYVLNRNRNPLKYMRQLRAIIKENRYDVVHVHGNSATMAVDLLVALTERVGLRIAHCHNTECKHKAVHKLLMPIFLLTYTKALACSKEAGKWIFGEDNFEVFPNGIPVRTYGFSKETRSKIRTGLHIENKLVIGHVGYFNKQKNHAKLLSIFKELKKRQENVHLLCVTGSEQVPDNIQRLIEDFRLGNDVTVLYKRIDVNRLMQGMDIFVFPSLHEGFSVALLEAQAAGLPCIVSDRIAKEGNLTGRVKFCPLEESDMHWADRILDVDLPADEERGQDNADMLQSEFNIEKSCKKIMELYGLGD
jgi:glycosyltransferase involved in cell wall biosynthesis